MLNLMNNPLKVALMSISPHNRAILEFFFAGAGKKIFTPVEAAQAEALIIDFDHPGGKQEWQAQHADDFKPAIVISVKETMEDKVVWVPKPLTSKALTAAAQTIREMAPVAVVAPVSAAEQAAAPSQLAETQAAPAPMLPDNTPELRPFGLSGQQRFKAAPPVAPQPKCIEALVQASESAPEPEPSELEAPEQHFLRTEDVFIPPPLEAAEELSSADGARFSAAEVVDDPIKQEQRWDSLCGREQPISRTHWHESEALYSPENYLLNSLVDALQLSHQSKQYVQLEINGAQARGHVLLMPDVNLAYSSAALLSDEFAAWCVSPLKTGTVQLHLPSTTELAVLEETVRRDAENTYDMEALIWTTSLLTSRGRLSRNADLTQPLRLRHWPNLPRLEAFPHVMQIAAAWQQRAGTVFDVAEWFDIPQRYVIAFYNAAHTLSLLTVEQAPVSPAAAEPAAPRKNRGLFSRLLKRLLGGGAK